MNIRHECLFEAITGKGWEYDQTGEAMIKSNPEGSRRLVYRDWGEWSGGRLASLSVRFKNSPSGWTDAGTMNYLLKRDGDEIATFGFVTRPAMRMRGTNRPLVVYDKSGLMKTSGFLHAGRFPDARERIHWAELVYPYERMIPEIDVEMTANLWVDQFCQGEIRRPILVPKGLFTFEPPKEVSPGVFGFSNNIERAAVLMRFARTLREQEIANAIYSWALRQTGK